MTEKNLAGIESRLVPTLSCPPLSPLLPNLTSPDGNILSLFLSLSKNEPNTFLSTA
jgi:hypothetical protein